MKIKIYNTLRKNIGGKKLQQNCGALIAKIDFLTKKRADKITDEERKEMLHMLLTIEKSNQHLSDINRDIYHLRLNTIIQECHKR